LGRCYSAVEHLAKTVLLNRWKDSWWAVISASPMALSAAYFDESRVDGSHAFPVVAGFWNTVEKWMAFEKEWEKQFSGQPKKYGRVRLHMQDSEEEKQRYEDSLLMAKLIRDSGSQPIDATIEAKAFQKPLIDVYAKKKNAAPMFSSVYTICSYTCCELLDEWARTNPPIAQSAPIKIVFDDGNENKVWLERGYRVHFEKNPDTHLAKVPLFEDDEVLPP
jgi:hypothetical protein